MKNWDAYTKRAVKCLVVAGMLGAAPMVVLAAAFDIDDLLIDVKNRYPNVGVYIGAIIDEDGKPVAGVVHCSGVLIHEQVFLTAGHCTGPTAFPLPPIFGQFVSIDVDVLDQSKWIRVSHSVTDPTMPPCPLPPGCDPTLVDVFHAGEPGIGDHGLAFLSRPVKNVAPAKLAAPGTLDRHKYAGVPMTIVGFPLPEPFAEEDDWDGLRRFRASHFEFALNQEWATWSVPSNVCFGDSGGPIFINDHPDDDRKHDRLVATVSDGGIDCSSANTNARLDTVKVQQWIRHMVKSVLGEEIAD